MDRSSAPNCGKQFLPGIEADEVQQKVGWRLVYLLLAPKLERKRSSVFREKCVVKRSEEQREKRVFRRCEEKCGGPKRGGREATVSSFRCHPLFWDSILLILMSLSIFGFTG